VLAPEPAETRDGFFYAMLMPLGIQKAQPFNPTAEQKEVLSDAAVVGDLLGRLTAYSKRVVGTTVYPGRKREWSNMVELDQWHKGYAQLDERASSANYVQTLPGKGWFTYFRLYGPTQAYFDKTRQLPDIEGIDASATGTGGR
jgi:hypothetical protein